MNIAMLLEMVADAAGDRVAIGPLATGVTYAELLTRSRGAAGLVAGRRAERLVLVDVNSVAVPVSLFGAALAGRPFVPVNYRLADDQLRAILARAAPGVAVVEASVPGRLGEGVTGLDLIDAEDLLAATTTADGDLAETDPDDIAVLLFTSGTTGEPKAAVLRHRHLTGYVLSNVELLGSEPSDAALVSVPPYHIAGIAAVLSSVFSGRRLVYLPQFDPERWVDLARGEAITHAMVVPTMLGRILDVLDARGESLPALRHLSYGGGRMPVPVVERAMDRLPQVGFVNVYGLTETSSTVAVLTPDDHHEAHASQDPTVRARLGSVGRPLPSIELEIRGPVGEPLPAGESGEVWVRGEQVSGEYLGRRPSLTDDGWFPTNDGGHLDEGGFLHVEGRLDDVIIRGGENLSPAEIEDALVAHDAVAEAAVVGAPDDEWGECPVAFVVLAEGASATEPELQDWVVERLRSARRPARIHMRAELPYSETGKLLRRVLKSELIPAAANPSNPR